MRRADFQGNGADVERVLAEAKDGQLGIVDGDGWPRVIPVNFIYLNGSIYFHGAMEGEKYELFTARPKVCFSAYVAYSYVPSYWRSPQYACPASVYYKSVHVRGTGSLVELVDEKAAAVQALMVKHQPEGRHSAVNANDPLYTKSLDEVAIFKVEPMEVTVKSKFGQNLPRDIRLGILENLERRGGAGDKASAEEIRRTMA